jgi:hypothetical protein
MWSQFTDELGELIKRGLHVPLKRAIVKKKRNE